MANNSRIQARIAQNQWKKKQELRASGRTGYVRGALAAAKVGKKIMEEGWTDIPTFDTELLRRMKIVSRRRVLISDS